VSRDDAAAGAKDDEPIPDYIGEMEYLEDAINVCPKVRWYSLQDFQQKYQRAAGDQVHKEETLYAMTKAINQRAEERPEPPDPITTNVPQPPTTEFSELQENFNERSQWIIYDFKQWIKGLPVPDAEHLRHVILIYAAENAIPDTYGNVRKIWSFNANTVEDVDTMFKSLSRMLIERDWADPDTIQAVAVVRANAEKRIAEGKLVPKD
jgi:hypothetical protein